MPIKRQLKTLRLLAELRCAQIQRSALSSHSTAQHSTAQHSIVTYRIWKWEAFQNSQPAPPLRSRLRFSYLQFFQNWANGVYGLVLRRCCQTSTRLTNQT
ncbi:hypothetical protein LY78DRAFT_656875 [Colletotrichum sublineola]|nr:hypothetical protein LY78DRAFT_656875 [Colletotrichum sublineola]